MRRDSETGEKKGREGKKKESRGRKEQEVNKEWEDNRGEAL